jgi:hypothetical protein
MMKNVIQAAVLVVVLLVVAAPASASVEVGHAVTPTGMCAGGYTRLQTSSSTRYTVPSPGVLTAWNYNAGGSPPMGLQLKVGRPSGGSTYRIVGESQPQNPPANTVSAFPSRISVEAGDVLGQYHSTSGECQLPTRTFAFSFVMGNQPLNTTASFIEVADSGELPLAAKLEPDADRDGFGDETQDGCATSATTHGPCPVQTQPPPHRRPKKCKRRKHIRSAAAARTKKCRKSTGKHRAVKLVKTATSRSTHN